MKRFKTQSVSCLFFSMMLLFNFSSSSAQSKGKVPDKIYFQVGSGGGTHNMKYGDLGLQAIFQNKWSATLSYQGINMSPKNLPADYQAEIGYIIFIPYEDKITTDMNLFSLTAGKYFKTGRNSWATIEGGVSLVNGEKLSFQHTQVSSINVIIAASTSSNYITFSEKKTTAGCAIKADINWPLNSFLGLGAGVFANFNSIQSPVGMHVKLMLGKMKKEKRIRHG